MNEEKADYTHNELSHKKEWNHAICGNMTGSWGHQAKWDVRYRKTNSIRTLMWNLNKQTKPAQGWREQIGSGSGPDRWKGSKGISSYKGNKSFQL